MVVVEARDVVPYKEPLKIKWRSKASEVEDEAIGEYSHLDWKQEKLQCYNCQKIGHYTSDY